MKDFQMGWPPALDYLPLDRPRAVVTPRRVPMSARERVRRQVLDIDQHTLDQWFEEDAAREHARCNQGIADDDPSLPQVYDPETRAMRPVPRKPVVKRVKKLALEDLMNRAVEYLSFNALSNQCVRAAHIDKEATIAAIHRFSGGVGKLTAVPAACLPELRAHILDIINGREPT